MRDFYESFYNDAVIISKELELPLTTRQEIPIAGVPCHTCKGHIDSLAAKGYLVTNILIENKRQMIGHKKLNARLSSVNSG